MSNTAGFLTDCRYFDRIDAIALFALKGDAVAGGCPSWIAPCIKHRSQSLLNCVWTIEFDDAGVCPKTLAVIESRNQCEALKNKRIDSNALAEVMAQ